MLTLKLPIKPYSVNQYFYGNRSIKRKEAREWELSVLELLRDKTTQNQIKEFTDKFNYKKHCIRVKIITQYPKDILYTKKNELSSRAFDITNTEKPLIDVLFLKKYATATTKNLQIDDKYIVEMISKKVPGDQHLITVTLEINDLEFEEDK